MQFVISTLMVLGLLLPVTTYADFVSDIIEKAKAGNGTYTESHSSASSGGVRVKGGESVSTGDVSASSKIETRINANNEGGEVKVRIESTENGVRHVEERTTRVGADESNNVRVATTSSSGRVKAESSIHMNGSSDAENVAAVAAPTSATGSSYGSAVSMKSSIGVLFSEKIPRLFSRVFAFIWRF